MAGLLNYSTSIKKEQTKFDFSICTLVNRKAEYEEMLATFFNKGFDLQSCEYLHIDNSKNCYLDAYDGLNEFLQQSQGKYIIICHQDILLHDHNKKDLENRILEIENADPNWAILANAGGINFKWIATNLTQGCGNVLKEKRLPLRTKTVDENFIIVKKSANLALSNNLSGFHMYGTDICLLADILGYTSYIINFNVIHKSDGNADQSFSTSRKELIGKYNKALRGRFLATTITRFYLSGNWFTTFFYNLQPIKFFVRQYYKIFFHKKRYVLKNKG